MAAAYRFGLGLDGIGEPLLGSFDTLECEQEDDPKTQRCLSFLRSLVGRRLLKVTNAPPSGDLILEFEGGSTLRTFSHSTKSDAWELRHRSGRRCGFCDCTYREWQEDADEPHA